ncbi:hypothetical protein GOV12_02790 [Candidatus Pacearchaeota archaeon]|nr:hypothetical protein [Candidatus Pacearchaeota archaeon]
MKTLLESFQKLKTLKIAKTIEIKSELDLNKVHFPYYMKASISGHKLEEKAVLRCENEKQAIENFNNLKNKFKKEKIIIQETIIGTEMILGLKTDPVFNKLLLIGFGGTNAEILKDIQFLAIPTNKDEIKKAIESLKLYDILHKRNKHNINSFIDMAFKVSNLKNISELDLNPVILNEKDATIVDARLE